MREYEEQAREIKDVESRGEEAMGWKRENTRKEIDELRGGSKDEPRKGGIKDTKEVTMLIHPGDSCQCHCQSTLGEQRLRAEL